MHSSLNAYYPNAMVRASGCKIESGTGESKVPFPLDTFDFPVTA